MQTEHFEGSKSHELPKAADLPAAILWDMDGTIVDTEPYWIAAEEKLVRDFGGTWSQEQGLKLVGNPLEVSAKIIQDEGGVSLTIPEIIERLIVEVVAETRDAVPWKPGALELLAAIKEAGIPCALVTMSYAVLTEAVIEAAPTGTFQAIVAGDQVENGKPHPEPYLRAAELLGVPIDRCIGVEDSPAGIASVEASGARLIAIQHLIDVPSAPGRSRITSLEDVDLNDLRRIISGESIERLR